jgi:hypothetical protein
MRKKTSPSVKKAPAERRKISKAQPFDPTIAAFTIKEWLPERLDINSDVWSAVYDLVNGRGAGSPLFADSEALFCEHLKVGSEIQTECGNRFFNRYEAVEMEMRSRHTQTAYAAGWVARSRQFESVSKEALDIADAAARIVDLTRMLGVVVRLVRTKAESVSDGSQQISRGAR